MSVSLRILLIVAAIITVIWILKKIRKSKVKMEDAIFWLVFSGVLLVLAVFPQVSFWMSRVLGIESPANLVFLLVFCLLIEKIFTLSIITSQLEEKVSILSAEIAIRSQAQEKEITLVQKNVTEDEKND